MIEYIYVTYMIRMIDLIGTSLSCRKEVYDMSLNEVLMMLTDHHGDEMIEIDTIGLSHVDPYSVCRGWNMKSLSLHAHCSSWG
jgi:hypothetical protein